MKMKFYFFLSILFLLFAEIPSHAQQKEWFSLNDSSNNIYNKSGMLLTDSEVQSLDTLGFDSDSYFRRRRIHSITLATGQIAMCTAIIPAFYMREHKTAKVVFWTSAGVCVSSFCISLIYDIVMTHMVYELNTKLNIQPSSSGVGLAIVF